jgi:hypothetical protein
MPNSNLSKPDSNLGKSTSESMETAPIFFADIWNRATYMYSASLQLWQLFSGYLYKRKLRQTGKIGSYVKFCLGIPSRSLKKLIFTQNRNIFASSGLEILQARLKYYRELLKIIKPVVVHVIIYCINQYHIRPYHFQATLI